MYRVDFSPTAERDLESLAKKLSVKDFRRIVLAIDRLSEEPRPVHVRKITSQKDFFRIRVGDYRVVYQILDNEKRLIIRQVTRRSEDTYKYFS